MREIVKKINICKVASVLLIIALAFSAFSTTIFAENGNIGNIFWDLSDGTLTISGIGSMSNFDESELAPWYDIRDQIRVIRIEKGITTIGDLAFYDCYNVTSVTIPNTVKSIGNAAFAQCKKLKILNIGANLEKIERSAFECCESLQGVRLPKGLTYIGERAFYRCYGLKTITIPETVSEIGNMAFTYCDGIVSVDIQANISQIPTWMFYSCTSLSEITLSETISEADNGAFAQCDNLSKISYAGNIINGETLLEDIQESLTDFSSEDFVYTKEKSSNVSQSTSSTITQDSVINQTVIVQETENSLISTTIKEEVRNDFDESKTETTVSVDAIIENNDGWKELVEQIEIGENRNIDESQIKVDVSLNDTTSISNETLDSLSGKNVDITIDMKDGSTIQIDCERLTNNGKEKDIEFYTLTHTLTENTSPTKAQTKTIGDAKSYLLSFEGDASFDFSPKVFIGKDSAGSTATLYQNVPGKGLELLQSAKIDKNGYATFYLRSIKASTEYVIALNVGAVSVKDAIIAPDDATDYGDLVEYGEIEYVTTGVRMFMGLSIFQFTFVILGVSAFLFIAVGIVMGVIYRRKKLEEYYRTIKANKA